MEQLILGIILGVVALGCVATAGWLIYTVHATFKAVSQATVALNRASHVFEKSASVGSGLQALAATNRQVLVAIHGMTAALQAFTGVVLQQPASEPPDFPYPPTDYDLPRRPSGRPPVPVMEYAPVDESGVLEQDDEAMAGIEFQRDAEARGEPTVEDILNAQKTEDIRASV